MLFIIYVVGVLLTIHNDALCCYAAKHKFNLKGSFIAALFFPVSVSLAILSVYKMQDKDNG